MPVPQLNPVPAPSVSPQVRATQEPPEDAKALSQLQQVSNAGGRPAFAALLTAPSPHEKAVPLPSVFLACNTY